MYYVLGPGEQEQPLTVPAMMKMLMAVYNNVQDDVTMDEVSEAVGDAICLLGDMRSMARDIMAEADVETAQRMLQN